MESDLTIEEMIELALHAKDCVISAVSEPDSFTLEQRKQLALLLEQVQSGAMHPERAEIQLQEINDRDDRWLEDNRIPPD